MPEEESLTNKDLFELLVDRLSDFAIILIDTEGKFLSWHPGIEKQFGYTASEFIGQNGEVLVPWADRPKGAFHQELQKAAETGRAFGTTWLVRKDGHPIFAEGVSLALHHPATGQLAGFGKVLHDITERKSTEEALKTLARTLDQSIVLIRDWDGTISHWTSGCQRLYGWTAQEAIGRNADELLHTAYPSNTIQEQLRREGIWQGELQQRRKDGSPVYVSAHWMMLSENSDGQPSIVSTHTDITGRLQMQRELEGANARLKGMALELKRSNSELEEFARIASHDLSAPIVSTRWLVELLANKHAQSLDGDGQKCLHQISLGLERMMDLVEAILAHARVGINPVGSTEAVDGDEALNIALQNLSKDLKVANAALVREPLPRLLIESQPLVRLFQNLLSNAVKYRRQNAPLQINVNASPREDSWLLSVQDNGIGIEAAWLERIFQPLQRPHGAEIAGSGIGLATCRKIVTRAGGSIWVESEAGRGSTFYFTLPGESG